MPPFITFHSIAFSSQTESLRRPCWVSLPAPLFQQRLFTLSLDHSLVILTIFQTFSIICYGYLWSEIFGVTIIIVLGYHKQCSSKIVTCIDKHFVCSDCPLTTIPGSLSFSSNLPIPWDTIILKLGQLITLQWPLSVQEKGKGICLSF